MVAYVAACLSASIWVSEGKVWLWLTIFTCLLVCGLGEEGSRLCGVVMR